MSVRQADEYTRSACNGRRKYAGSGHHLAMARLGQMEQLWRQQWR